MKRKRICLFISLALFVVSSLVGFTLHFALTDKKHGAAVEEGSDHGPPKEQVPDGAEPREEQAQQEREQQPPYQFFNIDAALGHIQQLSSQIGYRPGGSAAELRAASYIRESFYSSGYDRVYEQTFKLDNGLVSSNLYVVDKGLDPASLIVMGAHYDSAGGTYSPGANDNGSGVAVVLELARVFRINENVPTLVFVAFGSEEIIEGYGKDHHHYGSRYMANNLSELPGKVVGMISVDMVGVGSSMLLNSTLAASRIFLDMFADYARNNGVVIEFRKDPGCSDHEAFEKHGVPSFWVEYREDPNYHSPRDTCEKIKPALVNEVGHLLQGFLESLSLSDCRRLEEASVYR